MFATLEENSQCNTSFKSQFLRQYTIKEFEILLFFGKILPQRQLFFRYEDHQIFSNISNLIYTLKLMKLLTSMFRRGESESVLQFVEQ